MLQKYVLETSNLKLSADDIKKFEPLLSLILQDVNSINDSVIPIETEPAFDPIDAVRE